MPIAPLGCRPAGASRAVILGSFCLVVHLAVAVPAHVAGLCYALREYGTMDLKTVLAPAIRLCREGFAIDRHDVGVQKELLKDFADHPEFRERFGALYRMYANNGTPWKQ